MTISDFRELLPLDAHSLTLHGPAATFEPVQPCVLPSKSYNVVAVLLPDCLHSAYGALPARMLFRKLPPAVRVPFVLKILALSALSLIAQLLHEILFWFIQSSH
ncbi:hypothetical protein D3C71_1904130 [compost metagenome]